MPRRLTNLSLLLLVVALAATGLLSWVLPEASSALLYELHRVFGSALLLLLLWKQVIVRSSLRRRLGRWRSWDRSVVLGLVATPVLLGSLALGVAWTIGLVSFETFWGYSPLNLHIFLGLALLPLLVPHVLRRWERRATPGRLVDRRNALHLIAFSVGGMFAWRLLEWAAEARAEEGARRPSGSKHAGSFSGNDFPTTIWLFDTVPSLVDSSWRLELKGRLSEPGFISYDEMISLPTRSVRAVLDCTGGWWSEQIWQGVSVAEALLARGVHSSALGIVVVSVTGHRWSFPLRELPGLLLATHVGGEQLSPGHGYPVRLVAPGRRGFQWIKWVGSIEVV